MEEGAESAEELLRRLAPLAALDAQAIMHDFMRKPKQKDDHAYICPICLSGPDDALPDFE